MNTVQPGYDTQLHRVMLRATIDSEFNIEVVSIPATKKVKFFATAHGKRIKAESLMQVNAVGTAGELLICVYAHDAADVQAAITLAREAARTQTADALADAQALFKAAHSKPTITRNAWSAE